MNREGALGVVLRGSPRWWARSRSLPSHANTLDALHITGIEEQLNSSQHSQGRQDVRHRNKGQRAFNNGAGPRPRIASVTPVCEDEAVPAPLRLL